MEKVQRRGADASKARAQIIKAASKIIGQDGFAAVTAPRLAARLGLQRTTIYYYYPDMDLVRIAAVRYAYDKVRAEARELLTDANAVDVLWLIFERTSSPLSELTHYALRHEGFRQLLAEITQDLRLMFSDAISPRDGDQCAMGLSASGMAFLIQTVSTGLAIERRLGLNLGHAEVRTFFSFMLGVPSADAVDLGPLLIGQ